MPSFEPCSCHSDSWFSFGNSTVASALELVPEAALQRLHKPLALIVELVFVRALHFFFQQLPSSYRQTPLRGDNELYVATPTLYSFLLKKIFLVFK